MSSSTNEPQVTVSQTEVVVNRTEVTGPKSEITEIREDIGKISKGALKSLGGFRTFILRGNVVDLAIGIVIGAAFTVVVNSLVTDLITPLIPVSKNSSLATWEVKFSYVDLHIGAFINAVISFIIVAAVLYFLVVQPVNALMKLYHNEKDAPATQDCPYCFQAVNIKATRCPYCTSHLGNGAKHESSEKGPVLELPESLERLSETLAERIVTKATAQLEKSGVTEATSEKTE